MRTLRLLRHAKSDWADASLADRDRPLNARGLRAREVLAAHVAGWPVELVVVSTALRAQQTADPVVASLGCPSRDDDRLYDATTGELLRVVTGLPDEVSDVLVVAHNPGMEELHALLCGSGPTYPTAALGTIELAVDGWGAVRPGCGTSQGHVTAKELEAAGVRASE